MILKKGKVHDLLSSGIPLEYTVGKLLIKKGFWTEPDFTYKRDDKEFSIDFSATNISNRRKKEPTSLWLDLLVECKFNAGGHEWVFFPIPGGMQHLQNGILKKSHSIILPFTKQLFNPDKNIPYIKSIKKLINKTPIVWKGVGMFDSKCTETFIKEGLNQLKYAYIHKLNKLIYLNFPPYDLEGKREFAIIMLLITNNPLYIVDKKLTLNDFQSGKPIKLSKVNSLIYYSPLNSDNSEHNIKNFNASLVDIKNREKYINRDKSIEEIEKEQKVNDQKFFKKFDSSKVADQPSMIWIVNEGHLSSFLKSLSE